MSKIPSRRASLLVPLVLATLAGCSETNPVRPLAATHARLAQGDNGIWTVNNLTDVSDGTCDDDCSLREAIAAATLGGQIVFRNDLEGVIGLAGGQLFINRSVTINGGGRITLSGQATHRVMSLGSLDPITVTLDGLSLRNGVSPLGGAVLVEGMTTVNIRNSTIAQNTSQLDGGGIWLDGNTSLTLVNSSVYENLADNSGGGILNGGSLTVINSTVHQNFASTDGGGIFNAGSLIIRNSTISDNDADAQAGGIFNSVAATATIIAGTISGNNGKAITAFPGDGITSLGTLSLVSSTITRNTFGGLRVGGTATIANTIIAGNGCYTAGGTITSLGYNLIDAETPCLTTPAAGDALVPDGAAFTQVLEADLKDNGGLTKTHALIARGRAVDVGYCPGESSDQRGFSRPVDDPTLPNAKDGCDIGAYEAQGPVLAVADLMVSQTVDKASVKQGEMLTYTVRVQNLGPQTAPNVALTNILSSGVTFVEVRVNKGTTTAPPLGETGTVTWNLGDLADQSNDAAEIKVKVLVRGKTTITNTASVAGDVVDPNAANNSAAITVSVLSGRSGKP